MSYVFGAGVTLSSIVILLVSTAFPTFGAVLEPMKILFPGKFGKSFDLCVDDTCIEPLAPVLVTTPTF